MSVHRPEAQQLHFCYETLLYRVERRIAKEEILRNAGATILLLPTHSQAADRSCDKELLAGLQVWLAVSALMLGCGVLRCVRFCCEVRRDCCGIVFYAVLPGQRAGIRSVQRAIPVFVARLSSLLAANSLGKGAGQPDGWAGWPPGYGPSALRISLTLLVDICRAVAGR